MIWSENRFALFGIMLMVPLTFVQFRESYGR